MAALTRRLRFISHYSFILMCIIAALVHCFIVSTDYFTYRVRRQIAPSVPLDLSLPKLSLCFSLDSLLSSEPEKFFFFENNSTFNQTIRYLMNKTTAIDQMISECAYRDWKTDSVVIKQPSDCIKYLSIRKYMTLGHSCYEFDPGTVKYSFFDAINSLERRRFLYRISLASPLNEGHKVYPLIHHSKRLVYELLYAQDILTSINEKELYLISLSSCDLTSLPFPYETKCKVMSDRECFTSCMARQLATQGFIDYYGTIHEDDSLTMPNFSSPVVRELLSRFFNETTPLCERRCGSSDKCSMNFLVTSVHVSPAPVHKLSFEVQTLSEPVLRIKTVPEMVFLEFVTQFTSVCGFWLGFSFLQLLQGRKIRTPSFVIKSSCSRVRRVERQLHRLMVRFSKKGINLYRFIEKNKRIKMNRMIIVNMISVLLKCAALAGFCMQVRPVLVNYFKYEIEALISVDLNPSVRATSIHLCIPALNETAESDLSTPMTRDNYQQVLRKYDAAAQRGRPVSELMNSSQPISQILLGCRFRSNDLHPFTSLDLHSSPECLNHFKIEKYFMNDQICHRLTPGNHLTQHSLISRRLIMKNYGILYTVIVSRKAFNSRIQVILSEEPYPSVSRHYAAVFQQSERDSLYILSTAKSIAHLLPPPYQTQCDPHQGRDECLENCLMNFLLKDLNHLPNRGPIRREVVSDHPRATIMNFSDWMNESISKKLQSIENLCSQKCRRYQCEETIMKTVSSHAYRSDSPNEFAVSLRSVPDQIARAEAKTSMTFIYYQISCCANFWLGFVYISIGLFKLRSTRVRERAVASINRRTQELKSSLLALREYVERGVIVNRFFRDTVDQLIVAVKPKNSLIRSTLAKLITTGGCCIHLFLCLDEYLKYPSLTAYAYLKDSSTNYELSVCNSLIEERSPHLFTEFEKNQISRDEVDSRMDKILRRPVKRLMLERSSHALKLVDCSALGLRGENNLSNHLKDLTDRLLFSGDRAEKFCENIFSTKVFFVNGLICHRFIQKKVIRAYEGMKLSSSDTFFSVTVKRDDLTPTFSVMIGVNDGQALFSSLWFPLVFKPDCEARFIVSYIKYLQIVLPYPYNQGPTNAITMRCMFQCIYNRLRPLNVAYGFAESNSSRRFICKSEMRRVETQSILQKTHQECESFCTNAMGDGKNQQYFVTKILGQEVKNSSSSPETIKFVVTKTQNPVIALIMMAQYQLLELFINLGSIFNAWFGLSLLSFDPRSKDSSTVQLDSLRECESCLSDLSLSTRYSPFISKESG